MLKKLAYALALICIGQSLFCQDYNWWINGQVFEGIILPYGGNRHLIKGRPSGFELNIQKELNGTEKWQKLYNLPTINYGFAYYDLKNDAQLGALYLGSLSIDLPLGQQHLKDLFLKIGTGLVYSSNPYNRNDNNQNNLIGSSLSYLLQFGLKYEINLNDQIKITPGINLTHASNGAQAIPNRGLNIATANVGVSYKLINNKTDNIAIDDTAEQPTAYNYKYYLLVSSGKNTLTYQARNAQFFFNITLMGQKYLSPKSDLQFGIEYFHSNALKTAIATSWFNKELNKYPDFRRAALLLGHEFKAGNIGLITQLGVYIYQPSKNNMPVYQRYGLKYEFPHHIVGQFAVKAHAYASEQIEFGLGWRF